jgi:hypothetical protein
LSSLSDEIVSSILSSVGSTVGEGVGSVLSMLSTLSSGSGVSTVASAITGSVCLLQPPAHPLTDNMTAVIMTADLNNFLFVIYIFPFVYKFIWC